MAGVLFDKMSARRISRVVKRIEGMPVDSSPVRRRGHKTGTGSDIFKKPFDLINRTTTTVQLRGFDVKLGLGGVEDRLIGIAGIWKDIGPGAGGVDFDSNITISADTFMAIKIVTSGSGDVITLERITLGPIPDADDDADEATMFIPLWFIPFDTGTSKIIVVDIHDLRSLPRVDRMGN